MVCLKLLLIFICFWTNITLDFVTELLFNNNYNIVLIIINQLIKKRYYIPYIINKNNINAKTIVYLLFNNI